MAFQGKVVLITGASSGIGAETAVHFSKLGAFLALVGRNVEKLNEVVKRSTVDGVKKPLAIVADLTVDTQKIIDNTIDYFGKLDVLVNNAGKGLGGSIETTTLVQYSEIMDLNVRSVFSLTQLAIPYLEKTKGNIVNVSSVAGLRSFANATVYCISKAALDQFTRCVALDLAPKGIRVNSVNPAVIETNFHLNLGMTAEQYQAYLESCKATHALGRHGKSEEVAEAIAFLASDKSASFLTGTLLPVDGGKAIMCPR